MRPAVLLVMASVFPVALPAQRGTPQDSAAQAAYARLDWPAAVRAYEALVARDTGSPQYRFRYGVALMAVGRHADARPHFEAAERLGTPVGQTAFRLALIVARSDLTAAFAELRRATDAGLAGIPTPAPSPEELAPLQKDARYAGFLEAMDANAHPCLHDPRYRELDFWLGTWDVRPTGQPNAPPATNVVTREDDGCVLHESWTAPRSVGQSFNIYDRSRGKWFQTWVDNSGGLHEYSGNLVNGAMVYEGELAAPPPSKGRVHTRLTFTPSPEGVRQYSERTTDGGKTWIVNYDLFYSRRKP